MKGISLYIHNGTNNKFNSFLYLF